MNGVEKLVSTKILLYFTVINVNIVKFMQLKIFLLHKKKLSVIGT